MLDQQLSGGHVAERMHGVDGAAFGVDVGELGEGAVGNVREELIGVDNLLHGVVLDPLVDVRVDDVALVVVLPRDVLLVESLKDGSRTGGSGDVGEPASGLSGGVVDVTAGRAGRGEHTVRVGRSGVLSVVGVEESIVLSQGRKRAALGRVVALDDKGTVTGSGIVLLGLSLNEARHVRDVTAGGLPLAVDLVAGTSEVVVGIRERDLILVRAGTDHDGLVVDGPVGVGELVAELDVAETIDVVTEVPVSCDVVEGVVLHHEVDDMGDLGAQVAP